jgi:CheY-like chemotaxis protein
MRRLLANTLAASGVPDLELIEAADGREALARLAEIDYAVDAVFCDLCMPNLDGLGLLDALAEHGVLPSCPVIVLTADARKTHGREALLRGATALLRKPFTPEGVGEVLRKAIAEREAAGS